MDYCFLKVATITQKIILACKPYQPFNEKSLEDYIKQLDDNKKDFDQSSVEKIYEILKKNSSSEKLIDYEKLNQLQKISFQTKVWSGVFYLYNFLKSIEMFIILCYNSGIFVSCEAKNGI